VRGFGNDYMKHPILAAVAWALMLPLSFGEIEDLPDLDLDGEIALAALEYSASQGDISAQARLGSVYHLGLFIATDSKGQKKGMRVPKDYPKAFKWYRKAADRGHAGAQNSVAEMYHSGKGVPRNDIEAAKWYRRAASQGIWLAQYNLGLMYRKGEGVSQDYVNAYVWLNVAAARQRVWLAEAEDGRWNAAKHRDDLGKQMTADQVAEAQRLSRELYNRIESSMSE